MMTSRSPLAAVAAALLGAIVLFLVTRTILTHSPLYDEMLHVTAAQGLLATGKPVIADGEYRRARLYTQLVASSFKSNGVSLEAARLPARISAILLVALLGAWIASRAGLFAGASAAVLLASVPSTFQLAVFARFYTLHALLVLCAAIAAYEATAVARPHAIRVVLGLMTLACMAVAMHLQPTTVVAFGAMVLGIATVLLYDHSDAFVRFFRAHRPLLLGGGAVALAAGALLFWKLDLLSMAGEVPLWAEGQATRVQFYIVLFSSEMPLFWPTFLAAALLAVVVQPRLAAFCTVFFLSALAVHSIAAAKAARYAYYVLPFMFAVHGIAVSALIQHVMAGARARFPSLPWLAPAIGTALLFFIILSSQELQRAARLATNRAIPGDVTMFLEAPNWDLALPSLREFVAKADTKIVSSGVKGVYYLGGYDYELNASVVRESESGEEFGKDLRTGRKVISTPESLGKVLDQAQTALVVIERTKLAVSSGVPGATVTLLADRCEEIPLPAGSALAAWQCQKQPTPSG